MKNIIHFRVTSAFIVISLVLMQGCRPFSAFRKIDVSPVKNSDNYHIKQEERQFYCPKKATEITLRMSPNGNWPAISDNNGKAIINWNFGSEYTQIDDARNMVLKKIENGYRPIRVAVFDIGYPKNTKLKPDLYKNGPDFWGMKGNNVSNGETHALATTNILAGGKVVVYRDEPEGGRKEIYRGYLGAAPMVEVISIKVSPKVYLFGQSPFVDHRLQYVLKWAIDNDVDVISMSMGGAYSKSMAKAVGEARENGVAMFFAGGNYTTLPFLSLFRTPDTIVFPAAMSGAMGVTGATATNRTYGYPPTYFSFMEHGTSGWLMRGNWGPEWQMKKNIIAGYSPNVAWAGTGSGANDDYLDMDGQGTSAATPQVAGSAALWLQYYRDSFTDAEWRSSKKVDAVYRALADSAKRLPAAPRSEKYTTRHFGHGIVRAKDALGISPSEASKRNIKSPIYQPDNSYNRVHAVARTFALFSTERLFFREKDLIPFDE